MTKLKNIRDVNIDDLTFDARVKFTILLFELTNITENYHKVVSSKTKTDPMFSNIGKLCRSRLKKLRKNYEKEFMTATLIFEPDSK